MGSAEENARWKETGEGIKGEEKEKEEKEEGEMCKCARGETCFVLVRKALLQMVELAAWKKASRALLRGLESR